MPGLAGGVDPNRAVGLRDQRAMPFQQRDQVVFPAKVRATLMRSRCTAATVEAVRRAISPGCGVITRVRPLPVSLRLVLRKH